MANLDPLINQQVGNYRVIGHLARGGLADVYLAQELTLDSQVVQKVTLPHLTMDDSFAGQFQRAVQTTAQSDLSDEGEFSAANHAHTNPDLTTSGDKYFSQ